MEKVVFRNSLDQRLFGILHRGSSGPGLGATIVLCHGMMSAKEGTKQKAFAQVFEESGFSVLRFDFSFCGESEGRFEEITFAQEVDDLRAAVGWVRERGGIRWAFSGRAWVERWRSCMRVGTRRSKRWSPWPPSGSLSVLRTEWRT